MKLGKGKRLWVAELRGTAVFTRTGTVGRPGVPKAKELESEAAAHEFIEKEKAKRLADGFEVLDPDAGLDAPFTVDGKRKRRTLSKRYTRLVEDIEDVVHLGFHTAEEIDGFVDEFTNHALRQQRTKQAERRRAMTMTMDERHDDNALERVIRAEYPDEEDRDSNLRALLYEASRAELARLRHEDPPDPWVNDAIRRAFEALGERDVVALENPGGTNSACRSAVAEWSPGGPRMADGCAVRVSTLGRTQRMLSAATASTSVSVLTPTPRPRRSSPPPSDSSWSMR